MTAHCRGWRLRGRLIAQKCETVELPGALKPNVTPLNPGVSSRELSCNRRHLKEHMQEIVDDVKLETEDDVYFGYFNVHDTDKDG